jgi:hypothetical protein
VVISPELPLTLTLLTLLLELQLETRTITFSFSVPYLFPENLNTCPYTNFDKCEQITSGGQFIVPLIVIADELNTPEQ